MGAVCMGNDGSGNRDGSSGADGAGAPLDLSKLTATQRTCLDSWRAILDGKTSVTAPTALPKGTAPGTLFFDTFYTELQRRSPATAAFFAHGGIPRKARALMRLVASLLALGGDSKHGAAAEKEAAELAAIAEKHARAHGVGPTHYEPYMASLQHALCELSGGPSEGWTADVAAAWQVQCDFALGCMLPAARVANRPLVAIIGGGFAGRALAKELEDIDLHRVLLIERKDFLLFNVGGLRAAVRAPDFVDQVLLPLNLCRTTILPADVLEILPDGVRVHGRETLVRFDVCVIATGSSYAFPGKIPATRREDVLAAYTECATDIKESEHIVIAGGGAVGVELAGEIACWYRGEGVPGSAGARKQVMVLQRASRLVPMIPSEEAHPATLRLLNNMGVTVHCNEEVVLDAADRAQLDSQTTLSLHPKRNGREVKTAAGHSFPADVLFFCAGTKINSASFEQSFAASLNGFKQLLVNEFLQVRDPSVPASDPPQYLSNIFALGDCAAVESNQLTRAERQAKWLAGHLIWRVKRERAEQIAQLAHAHDPAVHGRHAGEKYRSEDAKAAAAADAALANVPAEATPYDACPEVERILMSVGDRAGIGYTSADGLQVWNADADGDAEQQNFKTVVRTKSTDLFAPLRWQAMGLPFAERNTVQFTCRRAQAEQEHKDDAEALAQSMQVSLTAAKQLLQRNAGVLHREANVMYT